MKIQMDMLRIPDIIAVLGMKECCTGTFENVNAIIKKIQNAAIDIIKQTLLVTFWKFTFSSLYNSPKKKSDM